MISKNNHQFYQQKNVEKKQRWGLRKLSVGVASVLLGTTFMLHSNHAVSADTIASGATPSTTTSTGNTGTGGQTYPLQPSGDSNATTDNGKDQKVTSPQPALVQKNVTPTASTDAVADYTPATPTTDKAGVTTGVYNNPLVTSSDWIKMTHGDAIGYYTAKGKDGKTYVTGYVAAKGNSQSIFNVDQIDLNSLEFHLLYHNGDKEVSSGLWFSFADGKTLKVDTSRLGSDGIQLKSSQQGQSYKWAIHGVGDGGNYYNSWAEYLKAHNNVGDQATEISMTWVALKPDDTIEFVIPVKYTGQLSATTPSLTFAPHINDYGNGFTQNWSTLYFTTVKKDLSEVKQVVLLPTEFMGEQSGESDWKLVKEISKDMPNGWDAFKISNFPTYKGSFNMDSLPKGDLPSVVYGTAQYFIDLSKIQEIFANHGYTVKYATNNGKAQEMPFYAYSTIPLAKRVDDDKPVSNDPSIWVIHVQAVPAIILDKDQHYVADPNAKPWDPTSMIDEIYAADDAGQQRKTRDQLEKLPKTDVDISYEYQAPGAATAVAVDKVDLTKAGVYTVTYSHTYANNQVVKDSRKVYVYDVKKDITRTIIVHAPNGTDQTVKQTATLTREVIRDATTGEIKSVGKWSTAKWEAYSAPKFEGYTPDKAQVDETTVNENTPDTTVEISYTANETPAQPDHSKDKDKDQGQKPQTPASNENGKHDQATGENTQPSGSTTKTEAPVTANKVAKKLPQTGEKENQLGLLGVVLAALGVFGFGWKKREHE
ncbi:YSIRK-type signal peptide-containing protein [Limosilactobacillus oris]|uniref:mucin-binding protein n=1 Tax=Limosilactobacillus oris TaxID=1632 RepID=UPI0021B46E75|nr:YSIRK-type signal peptide-containing protein [Limosilactobacillus oris]UXC67302.1 YSIRK-type signal peptide-containing protein [Limosilactobacillus oris]